MKKVHITLIILLIVLLLSSCNRQLVEGVIVDVVKTEMYNKYAITVSIESIELKHGLTALDSSVFNVVANNNGQKFLVYVETTGKVIRDTYAEYLLEDRIHKKLEDIIGKHNTIKDYSYKVIHTASDIKCTPETSLADYFKFTDSYISLTININDDATKDDIDCLYNLLQDLEVENFSFSVSCNYRGNTLYITSNNFVYLMTYDELQSRFNELGVSAN